MTFLKVLSCALFNLILQNYHSFLRARPFLIFFRYIAKRSNFSLWLKLKFASLVLFSQFSSVSQLCLTLCDPMNCSMPGLAVHHQLLEFTQTHLHRVGDAIQPSHHLSIDMLKSNINNYYLYRRYYARCFSLSLLNNKIYSNFYCKSHIAN